MNEIPSNDLVEEWLETHLTPEINTELTQMRDDWEKERQEYLKQDETGHRNLMTDLSPRQQLIKELNEKINDAFQSDLEHGVKALSIAATEEFHRKYPALVKVLEWVVFLSYEDYF